MSIFDEKNRLEQDQDLENREWWKYTVEGDMIEGTLVARRDSTDLEGRPQTLYDLNLKEGSALISNGEKVPAMDGMKFTVSGKPSIDRQMNLVKLGQIVGFKFTEMVKTKAGRNFKNVAVYADPKVIDAEWVKNNPELAKIDEAFGAKSVQEDVTTVEYED